jgi:hypothetical protein
VGLALFGTNSSVEDSSGKLILIVMFLVLSFRLRSCLTAAFCRSFLLKDLKSGMACQFA